MTVDSTKSKLGSSGSTDAESKTDQSNQSNGAASKGAVNRYDLLNTNQKAIENAYAQIRKTAKTAESIVDKIVREYGEQLDVYVSNVEARLDDIRDGRIKQFSDNDLQQIVLRLPILMYRLGDMLDLSAIESDISKAALQNLNAQNYLDAPGRTVPEKKAHAELQTQAEASVVDLSRHVYQRLKNKIENASALFDAVRKIITMRDTERTVFGRSTK
jgi:hypothetical protein